jgi:CubicO group peptidase (beta-lactamase class C family)
MPRLSLLVRFALGVALLAAPVGVTPVSAQPPSPLTSIPGLAQVDSLVSAEFARDSLASITIGVVSGGTLVWTRSLGFADISAHRLATRATVYRIGSVTKMFTGVMLHQLLAKGRVRLADPVARYVPQFATVRGLTPGTPGPTILQLATMTSGLASEPEGSQRFSVGPVSRWRMTLLDALKHTQYEHAPGTAFNYSNIGYAVLGAALERAAGTSYLQWQERMILRPLGMIHTRFDVDATLAGDLATGYEIDDAGATSATTSQREVRDGRGYRVPVGSLFSTVDDLSRFMAFQLGHGSADVLPPARLDSAYAGVVATSSDLEMGYGLGFLVQRRGDFPWVGHSGGVPGYAAMLIFDRDHQLGIVALRNATGGRVRLNRLSADALKLLILAKLSSEQNVPRR